MYKQKLLSKR